MCVDVQAFVVEFGVKAFTRTNVRVWESAPHQIGVVCEKFEEEDDNGEYQNCSRTAERGIGRAKAASFVANPRNH